MSSAHTAVMPCAAGAGAAKAAAISRGVEGVPSQTGATVFVSPPAVCDTNHAVEYCMDEPPAGSSASFVKPDHDAVSSTEPSVIIAEATRYPASATAMSCVIGEAVSTAVAVGTMLRS